MPTSPHVPDFVPLAEDFISSACRLSTQAGWNQTEEDWRRLTRLPGSQVRIWADAGEIRVSYSVVAWASTVAWIGMMLVDEAYRGTGLGKTAFSSALREAREFSTIGLDATQLGEPIYLKNGFQTICPIVRWAGSLKTSAPCERDIRAGLSAGVLELDARVCGVNRSLLLKDFQASGAPVFSLEKAGETTAFGILRPGRTASHLGPVVASSGQEFRSILGHAAQLCEGKSMICDALSSKAGEMLADFGLRPVRTLKRMTLPAGEHCLTGEGVWCGAGFELG